MPFGIKVTSSETPQSAGTSSSTGTAFILGLADAGPFTPTLVKSLAAYIATFGERSSTSSVMYDAVQTFFSLEGAAAYIQRVGKSSSAARASLELEAATHKEAIKVEAKYLGTAGNKLKIEVKENSGKTESEVLILNEAGEVLETTGLKKEAKSFIGLTSSYVIFAAGAKFSEGETEKLKAASASALTGGTNPTASITTALAEEALAVIPASLGPGQVLIPGTTGGPTEEATHIAMGEHALGRNRFALCDIGDSSSVATLISNKKTYAKTISGYMAFASSSCQIPGLVANTTRTVASSAVVAALCAQVSKTGNDNQMPCGVAWSSAGKGIGNYVISFTNTFTLPQMAELFENGINPFAVRGGLPVLYGFATAEPEATDKIFWQASAARERMHLIFQAEEIAESFLFHTIDGRGLLLAKFQGELQGVVAEHWKENALYGNSASEAGVVNVAEPINTPATEEAGELNAELRVRISPSDTSVGIVIVSVPITESVGT